MLGHAPRSTFEVHLVATVICRNGLWNLDPDLRARTFALQFLQQSALALQGFKSAVVDCGKPVISDSPRLSGLPLDRRELIVQTPPARRDLHGKRSLGRVVAIHLISVPPWSARLEIWPTVVRLPPASGRCDLRPIDRALGKSGSAVVLNSRETD
jgi:hypothetical protein